MADRTVKVSLVAQVSNYLAGMEQAAKKTKEVGTEAEKLAQKKEAFEILGKAAIGLGISASAAVALAVAKYAEFDAAMSDVQAATQATAADQKLLSDAALEAGASTVFSATESANAIEELSKAGLDTADILGGALKGSLDLASAGQLGVARAAEISATALQQFSLDGDQAGHVADVLAAGAGKAMGSVDDLAAGLKFAGPVANHLGVSLEQTTGVLALFAQQGIIGEQAGTGLRAVLSSLTSPSAQASKEIEKLGINLYDANGKFLGMENAAGELSKAYTGMDDASRAASMGIVFGRETLTAATALYKAGAAGVAEWTEAVDDSGYAAQVARDRLDNLKGDVEALGGAFDTALIQTGAAGNDVLREMTQTLTDVIDLYNGAPEPVKAVILATGGLTGAIALAGGAFFLATPKIAAFNTALATMGPAAQKAGALLTASAGPIGITISAAAVALAVFAGAQADAKARTGELTATLDEQTGALTKNTREHVVNSVQGNEKLAQAADTLGISLSDVTGAILGENDALARVNKVLDENHGSATAASVSSDFLSKAINGMSGEVDTAQDKWREHQQAMGDSAEGAEDAAGSHEELKESIDGVVTSLQDLATEIEAANGKNLDARESARQLEAAYDDFDAALKENGATLDITTEKGRANQGALDAIAQAALDSGQAIIDAGGGYTEYQASLESSRKALLIRIGDLGVTGQAAQDLADDILGIPSEAEFTAIANTAAAEAALRRVQNLINGIGATAQLHVSTGYSGGLTQANGAVADYFASGGIHENHVAQIAPAGAWRVWAEPETGGESYIPLAASKRARSLEIWEETGKRLGVAGYASGGIQYASNQQYRVSSAGPTEVVLNGATLIVNDVNGQLIGRMQVEADQRIRVAGASSELKHLRGRQV